MERNTPACVLNRAATIADRSWDKATDLMSGCVQYRMLSGVGYVGGGACTECHVVIVIGVIQSSLTLLMSLRYCYSKELKSLLHGRPPQTSQPQNAHKRCSQVGVVWDAKLEDCY